MRLPWNRQETELDREVRYHLESLADSFERQGMGREEAMRQARREFGGVERYKEQCRDESRWQPLAQLRQDIAFGLRLLRKAPAVTGAAVLSLALGIGATTAILSLVDAVLWRKIGVPNPEQITEILWQASQRPRDVYKGSSGSQYLDGPLVVADFFSRNAFHALREKGKGRIEVAGHRFTEDVSTSYAGVTAVAKLRAVSGNFFPMLRLQPALGRLLLPSDDNSAAPLTVVASDFFWRTNLGSDPNVIGRMVRINNHAYTICGVLPPAFTGITPGEATDLYTTMEHSPSMLEPDSWYRKTATNPMGWATQLIARRNPAFTNEALAAAMQPIFASSWAAQPKSAQMTPILRFQDASTGLGRMRRDFGNPFALLFVLVAIVLLIACANIANLLLARADARRKEVALRVSLGCSRARLIRQFFTESALLAATGGLLSIGVAYATATYAVTLMPGDLRLDFRPDLKMILSTLAVTTITAFVFGLYPAWRTSRVDAGPALKEGGGSIGGVRHRWLTPGKILVLAQVALGVLLVTSAAVFTAHLRKIITRETGFERTRLLMFDLRPGQSGYREERLKQFYLQLEQRLRDVPGVTAVGLANVRPMRGGGHYDEVRIEGYTKPVGTAVNFVTAGYLQALGVAIVAGRNFTEQEVRNRAGVAVVSEDFAKELGRSPLGLGFMQDGKRIEIVGVAANARYGHMTEQPNVLYAPHTLNRDTFTALLRTSAPPTQVLPGVRKAVAGLDSNLPLVRAITMEEQIAATLRRERLFAWLCGAFGVLALLLCMIGLYGVMSYSTARRSQEIGIRMALGASPSGVLRRIVAEGLGVALAGCAIGAPVAWWAAQRYIDYKKFGMDPLDPSIVAWTSAALGLSALLAVLGPAIRAATSDPVKALRAG